MHQAFPAQWFDGLLRALLGDRALLSPSSSVMRSIITKLDASVGAPGPHGFAVRKTSFVRTPRRNAARSLGHRYPPPRS
jgi:hypothetical protein